MRQATAAAKGRGRGRVRAGREELFTRARFYEARDGGVDDGRGPEGREGEGASERVEATSEAARWEKGLGAKNAERSECVSQLLFPSFFRAPLSLSASPSRVPARRRTPPPPLFSFPLPVSSIRPPRPSPARPWPVY